MRIKLSNGKPRGSGLFLVSHFNDDHLELIVIDDGWVFSYPTYNASMIIDDCDIKGWKKIDVEDCVEL